MIPQVIKENKLHIALLTLVVTAAAYLRLWQLDSLGILYGDAARDILVAQRAVETNTLPLVGIPSSVPTFHQGPYSIWLIMIITAIFGTQVYPVSLFFALGALSVVIVLYELLSITTSKTAGLIAATLYGISPLAIAQARVPFISTLIPLMVTLYLMALVHLKNKHWSVAFFVGLSWSAMFQFERNLIPLLILIPVGWYVAKRSWNVPDMFALCSGLVLGLMPLIVYDVSHSFTQTAGFLGWIVLRSGGFFTFERIGLVVQFWQSFATYFGRIFSVTTLFPALGVVAYLAYEVLARKPKQFKKSPKWWVHYLSRVFTPLEIFSLIGTGILIISFIVHGAVGEAYFPALLIFLPVLIGSFLSHRSKRIQIGAGVIIAILAVVSVLQIHTHSFFVHTPKAFSYGTSTGELERIAVFLKDQNMQTVTLYTDEPAGIFEAYFANVEVFLNQEGITVAPNRTPVVINPLQYPTSTTLNRSKSFTTQRVYW